MGICGSKKRFAETDRVGNQHETYQPRSVATQQEPLGFHYNVVEVQSDQAPAKVVVEQQQNQTAAAAKVVEEHQRVTPVSVKHVPQSVGTVHNSDTVLDKPYDDVTKYYKLGKELGKGQFGITYLCTEIATGHLYACKSILKRKLITKDDKNDVKREVQLLQHLSGQPNVVEFKGAYEDRLSVHLVMELCAGGELFDRIIAQGQYTERAAAAMCRQIVNVVHICHFMGVMHRDLKPENFLLSSNDENAMLKATDFGLSVFIEEGVLSLLLMILLYVSNAAIIRMRPICY